MKGSNVLLLVGAGLLGYLLAPKQIKETVTSGLGSALPSMGLNVQLPEINVDVTSPSPGNLLTGAVSESGNLTSILTSGFALLGQGLINAQVEGQAGQNALLKELLSAIEKLQTGTEEAVETATNLLPEKATTPKADARTQVGNFWTEWGNMVSGWQGSQVPASIASYDITKLLGTKTMEMILTTGDYEIRKGAYPWQTPIGVGFLAPWKNVLFDIESGVAVSLQEAIKGLGG